MISFNLPGRLGLTGITPVFKTPCPCASTSSIASWSSLGTSAGRHSSESSRRASRWRLSSWNLFRYRFVSAFSCITRGPWVLNSRKQVFVNSYRIGRIWRKSKSYKNLRKITKRNKTKILSNCLKFIYQIKSFNPKIYQIFWFKKF